MDSSPTGGAADIGLAPRGRSKCLTSCHANGNGLLATFFLQVCKKVQERGRSCIVNF
jgi:hypothetical protein